MTRKALAEAIGTSASTLRLIEIGRTKNPHIGLIANAAIALGVRPEEIWPALREWTPIGAADRPPNPRTLWYRAPFIRYWERAIWREGGEVPKSAPELPAQS